VADDTDHQQQQQQQEQKQASKQTRSAADKVAAALAAAASGGEHDEEQQQQQPSGRPAKRQKAAAGGTDDAAVGRGSDKHQWLRTVALGVPHPEAYLRAAQQLAAACGGLVTVLDPPPGDVVSRAHLAQDGCSGHVVFLVYDSVSMGVCVRVCVFVWWGLGGLCCLQPRGTDAFGRLTLPLFAGCRTNLPRVRRSRPPATL
jgi:hypothetical protein